MLILMLIFAINNVNQLIVTTKIPYETGKRALHSSKKSGIE